MTATATAAKATTQTTLKKLTPNLMVEDVNRTIDFYRDVLGFEVQTTVPEEGQLDWAMLARDGVTLMFQRRASLAAEIPAFADAPVGGALTFYTEVNGVEALHAQLGGRVEIVQDLHDTFYGTREFCFRDCNGYLISFSESLDRPDDQR
jgi:catechol 2,3-dioxygenase-like lactoylglutathione lyase family enzyme